MHINYKYVYGKKNSGHLIAALFFYAFSFSAYADQNAYQQDSAALQAMRGPLQATQMEAIQRIGVGVVQEHQGQGKEVGEQLAQVEALAKDLDEAIESEEQSAKDTTRSSPVMTTQRATFNEHAGRWAARLQQYEFKLSTDVRSNKFKMQLEERFKLWRGNIEQLKGEPDSSKRKTQLRQLRDSIRLSRYRHPDDAWFTPTPTASFGSRLIRAEK